jgi:GNAT superfamily N-acetyltransferase
MVEKSSHLWKYEVIIRPIQKIDLKYVAELHVKYLPSTFIDCKYTRNLLEFFYESFIKSNINMSFVAVSNGLIIGYICIVKSLRELYIKMIRRYYCNIIIYLGGLLLYQRGLVLGDLLNRGKALIIRKKGYQQPNSRIHFTHATRGYSCELRPIVIRQEYRGSGLASALIASAEAALKERREDGYFLKVYKNNFRAINFYRKEGFIELDSEETGILVMEKSLK